MKHLKVLKTLRHFRKLNEELKRLREIARISDDARKRKMMIEYLQSRKEEFFTLAPSESETLREAAAYDRQAWEEIVEELRSQ